MARRLEDRALTAPREAAAGWKVGDPDVGGPSGTIGTSCGQDLVGMVRGRDVGHLQPGVHDRGVVDHDQPIAAWSSNGVKLLAVEANDVGRVVEGSAQQE